MKNAGGFPPAFSNRYSVLVTDTLAVPEDYPCDNRQPRS